MVDGVGLARGNALHALAASGAIQAAAGLGLGLLGRIDLLHLAEIGRPLLDRDFVGQTARIPRPLPFQCLDLFGRERIGAGLAPPESLGQRAAGKIVVDRGRRALAVCDGFDHAGRSCHDVAAGKNPRPRRGQRQFVGLDGAGSRGFQAEQLGELSIGRLAHGGDERIGRHEELRSLAREPGDAGRWSPVRPTPCGCTARRRPVHPRRAP